MQIKLLQKDIEAALRGYLAGKNIATNGEAIQIVFTAGRKAGGLTADVTIGEAAPAAVVVAEDKPAVKVQTQLDPASNTTLEKRTAPVAETAAAPAVTTLAASSDLSQLAAAAGDAQGTETTTATITATAAEPAPTENTVVEAAKPTTNSLFG